VIEESESGVGDRPVWRILIQRGGKLVGEPPDKPDPNEGETDKERLLRKLLVAYESTRIGMVVKTPPGSGKSRDATEFVNMAWEEHGIKGLYLMLSHPAIEERLKKMEEDGKARNWTHWRKHSEGCERNQFNEAGYIGQGRCTCGRGELKAEGPTIAPIEYILLRLPYDDFPLIRIVEDFDFWIIDEVDFRRFLGYECVNLTDVKLTSETHPDEDVRAICEGLADLMNLVSTVDEYKDGLRGEPLYSILDVMLREHGNTLSNRVDCLSRAKIENKPWLGGDVGALPSNFPPKLVPVLVNEARDWPHLDPFNPCIHIVRGANGPEMHIWGSSRLRWGDANWAFE